MRHTLIAALAAAVLGVVANAGEPAFPDYAVTPLSKADFDLFMGILQAAADHNAHLTGVDKEAYDFFMKNKSAPPPPLPPNGQPTPQWLAQMEHRSQLLGHAGQLASFDVTIAKQRGVQKRYEAIKNEVESIILVSEGMQGECGDSDCGPKPTPAQIARAKAIAAALKADKPLVAPHAAEIRALEKRVNFML